MIRYLLVCLLISSSVLGASKTYQCRAVGSPNQFAGTDADKVTNVSDGNNGTVISETTSGEQQAFTLDITPSWDGGPDDDDQIDSLVVNWTACTDGISLADTMSVFIQCRGTTSYQDKHRVSTTTEGTCDNSRTSMYETAVYPPSDPWVRSDLATLSIGVKADFITSTRTVNVYALSLTCYYTSTGTDGGVGDTIALVPDNVAAGTQLWGPVPGASTKWGVVADAVTTTYDSTRALNDSLRFTLSDFNPAWEFYRIDSVKANIRKSASANVTDSMKLETRVGSNIITHTPTIDPTTTVLLVTYLMTTSPAGTAWDKPQLDSMTSRVMATTVGAGNMRAIQIWYCVYFTIQGPKLKRYTSAVKGERYNNGSVAVRY